MVFKYNWTQDKFDKGSLLRGKKSRLFLMPKFSVDEINCLLPINISLGKHTGG